MKTTLRFQFDHDEREEFKIQSHAFAMYHCISEYDIFLRNTIKSDESLTEEASHALQDARDELHSIMSESGIEDLF
jgi:hypothetical protein